MSRPGLSARTALLGTILLFSACRAEVRPAPAIEGSRDSAGYLVAEAEARELTAGFLIVDGVYNTELTAPFDILEHTSYHVPEGRGIEAFTVSPDGTPVTTAEGLRIIPDFDFAGAPPIDILVVPSAEGSRGPDFEDARLISWVRTRGEQAGIVMSLCWGAFVLAEAGLLDGLQCTTFPGDYASFAQRFPEHQLLVNVSFVHDGRMITSQGGIRSFDAAMYLVEYLYGVETARNVGNGLLVEWPPDPASEAARSVVRAHR